MLKKVLKWIGIVLGVIIILLLIGAGGLYFRAQSRLNQTYNVQVENVSIPTDTASIERGKHIASVVCVGCHGQDLGGTEFFNDPSLGAIHAKNLTTGKGGIGSYYKDTDYVRTLWHGVNPDGKTVFVMPAYNFHYLSEQDLGAIIAYLKSVPPVDKEWAPRKFALMGTLLIGAGMFDSQISAEQIDQTAPRPVAPAIGVTKEYGDYLITLGDCRNCHGKQLAGGKIPDPTMDVRTPNLTPGGELVAWSDADFIKTIRTGVTPSGHQLSDNMPWKDFSKLTDDELKAIFLYLQAQPKLPTATQ